MSLQALFDEDGTGQWQNSETYRRVRSGEMALEELGVPLPESFMDYLDLGRLRNALILNEWALRPTPQLERFINEYRLSSYVVPEMVETIKSLLEKLQYDPLENESNRKKRLVDNQARALLARIEGEK